MFREGKHTKKQEHSRKGGGDVNELGGNPVQFSLLEGRYKNISKRRNTLCQKLLRGQVRTSLEDDPWICSSDLW